MKKLDASIKPPAATRMEEFLGRYVVGQPEPIKAVARAYSRLESGFKDFSERYKDRPIGCFLLLGPSGVGKTELAKRLAQFFYGIRSAFTLVECVTYKDKHEVAKLIGAPPGYIGHDKPPRLSKNMLYSKIPGYSKKVETKSRHEKVEEPEEETVESFEDILLKNNRLFKNFIQELALIKEKISDIDAELQNIQNLEGRVENLPPKIKGRKDFLMLSKRLMIARRNAVLNNYHMLVLKVESGQTEDNQDQDSTEQEEPANDGEGEPKEIKAEETVPTEPAPVKAKEPVLIILFDEIEKADPSLYDFLLQVMEEGKTTLGNGEEIDLRNAFILMTSNAGSEKISDMIHGKRNQIGFTAGNRKKDIYEAGMVELRKRFSNEFLGRLDEVLMFNELTPEDYGKIFDMLLEELRFSLTRKFIKLVITKGKNGESIKQLLLKESANKPNQARFLQDLFRKRIIDPIENLVTTRQLNNEEVLIITAKGEELIFINYSRNPDKKPS